MKNIIKKALEILLKQDEYEIDKHQRSISRYGESSYWKKQHQELLKEIDEIDRLLLDEEHFPEFCDDKKCCLCKEIGCWKIGNKYICGKCLTNILKDEFKNYK